MRCAGVRASRVQDALVLARGLICAKVASSWIAAPLIRGRARRWVARVVTARGNSLLAPERSSGRGPHDDPIAASSGPQRSARRCGCGAGRTAPRPRKTRPRFQVPPDPLLPPARRTRRPHDRGRCARECVRAARQFRDNPCAGTGLAPPPGRDRRLPLPARSRTVSKRQPQSSRRTELCGGSSGPLAGPGRDDPVAAFPAAPPAPPAIRARTDNAAPAAGGAGLGVLERQGSLMGCARWSHGPRCRPPA